MKKYIFNKKLFKSVVLIALPVALQNLITFGVQFSDTVMIGKLGDIQLAAISQANQPVFLLAMFVFGLAGGGSVLTSQYWGKQNLEAVRTIIGIVVKIIIVSTILLTIIVLIFPEQIMSFYIKTETASDRLIISEAVSYLKIVAFSYLFFALSVGLTTIIRSVEIVKISVVSSSTACVTNIILNWVFIFGHFGVEPMGIRGAALATLIARIIDFIIVSIYLFVIEKKLRFRIHYVISFDLNFFKDYLKYSLPVVGNEVAWSLGITLQAAILGKLSSQILAANSVAMILQQLAIIVTIGVGSASCAIVGKRIGEGKLEEAHSSGIVLMVWSVIIGLAGSVLILLLRKPFVSICNISDEIKQLAESIMIILSVVIIFVSVAATSVTGVLRGAGDTRFAFKIEMISLWLIAIPIGFIAGYIFHAPIVLTYALLKIDEPIKAFICFIRTTKKSTYKSVTRHDF